MNYKTEQEKQDKEFEEKFKCIQGDCDGQGNIPYQVGEGEWLAEQCQFHSEYLFPIKSYLLTRDTALLEARKCDIIERLEKHIKSDTYEGDESTVFQTTIKEVINLIKND